MKKRLSYNPSKRVDVIFQAEGDCLSSGCHNKIPEVCGLNSRHLSSHNSGGWKSEIPVLIWSVSGQDTLPGLQVTAILLPAHVTSSFFTERRLEREGGGEGGRGSMLWYLFFNRGPYLWPHLIPLQALSPNTVTLGLRLQHTHLGQWGAVDTI